MTRHSRLSRAGIVGRAFLAAPLGSVLLALLVAVAALAAIALPRAVAALHTEAIAVQIAAEKPSLLDLTAVTRDHPPFGDGHTDLPPDVNAVWGAQQGRLEQIRDSLPQPLGRILGEPLALVVADPFVTGAPGQASGGAVYRIEPAFDPRLRDHVTLTEGEWPATFTGEVPGETPVEIVLADAVAERLVWEVGDERTLDLPTGTVPVVLSGTFAPVDPDDSFWSHAPTALEASKEQPGLGAPIFTGTAMFDPASWEVFQTVSMPIRLQLWFPLLPEEVTADELEVLVDQLAEVSSRVEPLVASEIPLSFRTADSVSFRSGLREVLLDAHSASVAVDAVLATAASGPIGVTVAVLVLGALVVFERRRSGLELAAARGASQGQLRGLLALEGLAIGVPAGIVGGVVGMLLTPTDAGPVGWWLVALFALAPAVLLVASAPRLSPLRRARSDLGRSGPGRVRWIVELAVVVVAVAAVVLLFRRGLSGGAGSSGESGGAGSAGASGAAGGSGAAGAVGVDPLLAAVPLLLALVVCILVLRLYPIPLARIVAALERRRGLVNHLGAARALRDPSAGLVPVLAVVVGVAVAVFSSVLLGTVATGIERSAAQQVGADLKVESTLLTRAQLDAIAEIPGVEAIAPVYSTSPAALVTDGRRRPTTVVVVDIAAVDEVQAGRDDALTLPERLATGGQAGDTDTDTDAIPVLASPGIAARIADADRVELEDHPVEVLGVVDRAIPFTAQDDWLLVDRAYAERVADSFVPRTVLVRLGSDASQAEVKAAVTEIVGEQSTLTTPESRAVELGARPAAVGLMAALVIAIVLTSLATALAIVLTLVVGRPARERLLPLLSTLGLPRRGERVLVAWEIGPVVVAAVVAGAVLGIALPAIVLPGIDLAAFTDASQQPSLVIDPLLIGAVLGGAIAVAAVAAWIAASVGGRVDAARAMRKEEEE